MGENNLFSNFLPNELETNPKIEVEQSASKDTSKYHQLSLFDFVYETGEFIINETNISQVNELPNDIVKNIENEATQENLAQKSNFELTMGYGISNSNKNPLPKIDFYKTQSFDLGGTKTRAENNLKALELALTITKQNRYATQEEQEILAKYSGFGGLNSAFKDADFNTRLKTLLDENSSHKLESAETYARLLSSSYNAYYTNDLIIDTIYQGLEQFGLKNTSFKKEILEPSCGSGNFLHRGDKSSYNFTGVELEKHSAIIANLLHPNSKIINQSYENFAENKKFDAIIGNPPFGQDKVKDSNSLAHNQTLDNYFAIKSLENLKDKGILAFVMPTGFLDNNQDKHLDLIKSARGKFLGAVRLPNSVFKENGTEVNTDIIFLQKEPEFIEKLENGKLKKVKNEIESMPYVTYNATLNQEIQNLYDREEKNINVDKTDFISSFKISSYFIDNPQNILGKQVIEKNQFGDYKAVVKDDGRDLAVALQNFVKTLPQNIYEYQPNEQKEKLRFDFVKFENAYISMLKNGNYFYSFEDNCPCQKLNEREYQKLNFSSQIQEKAKSYILLRDALNTLSNLELSEKASDEEINQARAYLNESYDFIKSSYQNKPLNKVFAEFSDELSFNFVSNLEDENNQKSQNH